MWLTKMIVFVGICGILNSVSGPKDFGMKVHRHVFEVTEFGQDNSEDNGEMVAQVRVKLEPSLN